MAGDVFVGADPSVDEGDCALCGKVVYLYHPLRGDALGFGAGGIIIQTIKPDGAVVKARGRIDAIEALVRCSGTFLKRICCLLLMLPRITAKTTTRRFHG